MSELIGFSKKASQLCGLSVETIYQWRAEAKKSQFKSIAVVDQRKKSVTVTEPVSKSITDTASVTVTTPRGYKIEGSSEAVVKILKAMGGL